MRKNENNIQQPPLLVFWIEKGFKNVDILRTRKKNIYDEKQNNDGINTYLINKANNEEIESI